MDLDESEVQLMYYMLWSGRIVSEREMRSAYEIATGGLAEAHPTNYKKWIQSMHGIAKIIPANEITIEQLVDGNYVEAVKLYRERNNCTLREAKETLDKTYKHSA